MSTRRRSIRHLVALRLASVLALVAAAIGPAALADDPAPVAAATLADHHGWVIAGEYSRDGEVIVTAGGDSLLYRPGSVIAWHDFGRFGVNGVTRWLREFSRNHAVYCVPGGSLAYMRIE